MREWQQTKFKDYVMPNAVYYQSIWAVRDLERMENRVAELNSQISSGKYGGSIVSDGQRNYSQIRPTENRVVEKVIPKRMGTAAVSGRYGNSDSCSMWRRTWSSCKIIASGI